MVSILEKFRTADLRKAIDRLDNIIKFQFNLDLFDKSNLFVFVFGGKSRTEMKDSCFYI